MRAFAVAARSGRVNAGERFNVQIILSNNVLTKRKIMATLAQIISRTISNTNKNLSRININETFIQKVLMIVKNK
jgi:hypothetical protein